MLTIKLVWNVYVCHTCVTNAFEICDEFVRILHTLCRDGKIRSVNIKVQQGFPYVIIAAGDRIWWQTSQKIASGVVGC